MLKIDEIAVKVFYTTVGILMICGGALLLLAMIPIALGSEIMRELKFKKQQRRIAK